VAKLKENVMSDQEKMALAATADQQGETQASWDFLEEFWGTISIEEPKIENDKDYMEGEMFSVRNSKESEVSYE